MASDESMHVMMQHQNASVDANDHANCDCGCDGGMSCAVSGCSAVTMTTMVGVLFINPTHFINQAVNAFVRPQYSNLLFRPPISVS